MLQEVTQGTEPVRVRLAMRAGDNTGVLPCTCPGSMDLTMTQKCRSMGGIQAESSD